MYEKRNRLNDASANFSPSAPLPLPMRRYGTLRKGPDSFRLVYESSIPGAPCTGKFPIQRWAPRGLITAV